MAAEQRRRIAVVGGGVAGTAAAYFLKRELPDAEVTVYEAAPQVGGKLAVGEIAGVPVDLGAEAILARRPEGVELAEAIGLADDLTTPATTAASIWSRGELRPLPTGHIMGVPGDIRALSASGLMTTSELARVRLDRVLPRTPQQDDVAIGKYVASRLGRDLVDRLVEPLLGGVYAGHASQLSLAATVPQLAPLAREGGSLISGVKKMVESATATGKGGPVFAGIRGGVGRLPAEIAKASGAVIETGVTVRELRRGPAGWQLTTGSAAEPRLVEADAVVIALPAHPASRLLADAVPAASTELAGIDYASMAIVTIALPRAAFPDGLPGSGFLVPPVDGRMIKAATFSSAKWGWLTTAAPDTIVLRTSVGRFGDETELHKDDADLVSRSLTEITEALGHPVGVPIASRVQRWGGALPQYGVGHLDRVRRVRDAVAKESGLAVCGAAYDGVGIPACIASAKTAARTVAAGVAAEHVGDGETMVP